MNSRRPGNGWWVLAMGAAVACRSKQPEAPRAIAPPPPPIVVAPRDASAAPVDAPAAAVDAAVGERVVDLLRATEATVRVSSAVANANDRPDRLVDGDTDTAWSSATGELERTWIELRLPADVRVSYLELTAGYTRAGGRRDLFTGNVRVSRVRVSHDGAALGEFALDPESRAMQRVPVQGSGGVWRVETVGLVPGGVASWREVTVSELRVMGAVGAVGLRAAPAPPAVSIGAAAAAGSAQGETASLEAALASARRELLGEGLEHEQGETGCSGAYAEHCVRGHWMAIADAAVARAAARCPGAVVGPKALYDRRRRTLSRAQDRVSLRIDRGGDTSSPEADEAMDALGDAAEDLIAACPEASEISALGPMIRSRDTSALRRFRLRQSR